MAWDVCTKFDSPATCGGGFDVEMRGCRWYPGKLAKIVAKCGQPPAGDKCLLQKVSQVARITCFEFGSSATYGGGFAIKLVVRLWEQVREQAKDRQLIGHITTQIYLHSGA
jgi:hypothetical protein